MIRRNVHVEVDYFGKSGTETIIFSIKPDLISEGCLVGKFEYSVAVRTPVQSDSTTFTLSNFTIANQDGNYDWLVDEQFGEVRVKEVFDDNFAGAEQKSVGLVKRARFDGENRIIFELKDKKKLLDKQVQDLFLPATEPSSVNGLITNTYYGREGMPRPYMMGFVYSIEPFLLNRSLNEYQIHDAEYFDIDAVYVNGVSVAFTDRGGGKFSLDVDPPDNAKVVVEGQGQEILSGTDFANFSDEVIYELLDKAGWTDYDSVNIDALRDKPKVTGGVYRPKIGLYIHPSRSMTFNEVFDWINRSTTGWTYIDALGDLIFGRLLKPEDQVVTGSLTKDDVVKKLDVFDDDAPNITTKAGGSRNWYVHTDRELAFSATQEVQMDFTQPFREVVTSTETLDPFYTDTGVPQDTLLPGINQTLDHINNLVDIYSVKRKFYIFTSSVLFKVGDIVQVTHPRFNIDKGKKLLCLGYKEDYINQTYSLILWG